MRIGVDAREFEPGARTGIGRYLRNFLEHAPLEAAGHRLYLYGNRRTAWPPAPAGTIARRLPEPARLWWDQVELPRALLRDRIDVFLSPYPKGPLLAPCPVVVSVHDLIPFTPRPGTVAGGPEKPAEPAGSSRSLRLPGGWPAAAAAGPAAARAGVSAGGGVAGGLRPSGRVPGTLRPGGSACVAAGGRGGAASGVTGEWREEAACRPGALARRLAGAAKLAAVAAMARRAACVVTVSEHARGEIVTRLGVPPERVVTVGNGVGPEFRPGAAAGRLGGLREALRLEGPYVLSVGNGLPHKNLGRLLEAFARIAGGPASGTALVIAGPVGPAAAALAARAGALGIGTRVHLPGRVADEDLPALYGGAELLAFPSLDEGFGLPPLEAMACGCPVVASRAGALPEVVGDAARLVDPLRVDELAEAMAGLLCRPGERRRLAALGLARARLFPASAAAERLLAVLESVAAEPTHGGLARPAGPERPAGSSGGSRRRLGMLPVGRPA